MNEKKKDYINENSTPKFSKDRRIIGMRKFWLETSPSCMSYVPFTNAAANFDLSKTGDQAPRIAKHNGKKNP